ncbi:MAG: thymidylate synthase [Patescibacteria group bacterium]|nr:thymidylate synthase [Patescibacteria group bacterium]
MKDWPIYYKDLLILGRSTSNIGLVTLWTPVRNITSKLDRKLFKVAGQLYSHRGINFIIRNILANPTIDTLLVCGKDLSGSGKTLKSFFMNGIKKGHTIIGAGNTRIDSALPTKAINDFRKNVKLVDLIGEINPGKISKTLTGLRSPRKRWAKPRKFPMPKHTKADRFPSEKIGFKINAHYIWEGWIQALRIIEKFGSRTGMVKVSELKEVLDLIVIIDEEDSQNPKIINEFPFNQNDLNKYYKNFFSKRAEKGSYNYGERIFSYPDSGTNSRTKKLDQIKIITEKMSRDSRDRGLICCLWQPWIDNESKGWMSDDKKAKAGNAPCLTFLQFTYRSRKLNLTAYFRSSDMFSGWPLNCMALRKLQYGVAKATGKSIGKLVTISNCAHVYEKDYADMSDVIKKYKGKTFCQPDERGACMIETKKSHIIVKHLSPKGDTVLQEYRFRGNIDKAALKIIDKLNNAQIFSRSDHMADIAIELTKAEYCIKKGIPYVQDRDWSNFL